jgi:outer membrane protein TolC
MSRTGWYLALACGLAALLISTMPSEAEQARDAGALSPLDLAALLREAEATNPEIGAARSRLDAAATVPSQVETPPDPLASVSYTNDGVESLTLGRSIMSNLTLSWTQEVPYPGKLNLGGDVARWEIEGSRRRIEAVQLDVRSRVKEIYADLYRIDRTLALLKENRALLASFLETARSRYEIGEGPMENVLKAQVEISKLDADLETLAQERLSAGARLDAAVGRSRPEPPGPATTLPEIAGAVDPEALVRLALERSPEIQVLEAKVRGDESRLDLAKRQLKPDLLWGASYVDRGDIDPMVMGSFGVRLPIHRERRQLQGIAQAGHEVEAARSDVEAIRLAIAAEVRDLAARASRAAALERLYAEGILPQSRNALESASDAYGVGRVDFLTLLSDLNAVLTLQIEYEARRAERVSDLAGLERLTATSLVLAAPIVASGSGGDHE